MRSPFYGATYLYGTPQGQREIGVMAGLGGTPIVGWMAEGGSRHRVKTPHLPAGTPEHELQAKLDAWASLRGLPRIIPSRDYQGDKTPPAPWHRSDPDPRIIPSRDYQGDKTPPAPWHRSDPDPRIIPSRNHQGDHS